VELIDLSNEGKNCPLLPNYPLEGTYSVATYFEGKVISCGGQTTGLETFGDYYSVIAIT